MDWGTFTVKDLVYASIFAGALLLGRNKVWAWFYQLEDCRTTYEKQIEHMRNDFRAQLEEARTSFRAQLETARADFRIQLEAAELRAEGWRELVLDGRALVKHSVNATVELAKKAGKA
jgi:hypothetical protein